MEDLNAPTRRLMLGASAALAAASTLGSGTAHAQSAAKTFVLVHGSWHGGWCWKRVADRLEKAGHRVYAPTNTGLGERSHLLTKDVNVSTHVTDIVNVFKWEDLTDVVLVGHSYGGLVISGVADQIPEKISSIVFLDAFLPEDGDDLISKSSPRYVEMIAGVQKRGEISIAPPPAAAFGVTDPNDAAWINAKCTPEPFGTYTEKVSYKGGREKIPKRTYIRAHGYTSPTFDANLAKVKANPGWKVVEYDCGHDVMVLEPEQLTKTLLELI
jgi:pimeloyl-ACP methyl ester carboxylesterase